MATKREGVTGCWRKIVWAVTQCSLRQILRCSSPWH